MNSKKLAVANQLSEQHRMATTGWLQAAVMRANDGILSPTSLVPGVAAAHGRPGSILLAGTSGLVAGAMAACQYASVYSQADIKEADLSRDRSELALDKAGEQSELAAIDGAILPLLVSAAVSVGALMLAVAVGSLPALEVLGAMSARVGGDPGRGLGRAGDGRDRRGRRPVRHGRSKWQQRACAS